MRVQSIKSNEQVFGVNRVVLDDSLGKYAGNGVLRAISEMMESEKLVANLRALGPNNSSLKLAAVDKMEHIRPQPDRYYLIVNDEPVDNPDTLIKSGSDLISVITTIFERLYPEKMPTPDALFKRALAATDRFTDKYYLQPPPPLWHSLLPKNFFQS